MFLPERLKSIRPTDRVLEVGPGPKPHPRASVCLDRRYANDRDYFSQHGESAETPDHSKTVFYDGGRFPFEDRQFDYVICSHVLEHIPEAELDLFISELKRVAGRGYVEFPSVFYDLLNFSGAHLWMMNARDQLVLLMTRSRFRSNYIHQACRELFYGADRYMYRAVRRYPEFFFCGFEWEGHIEHRVVTDYDELFNEDDLLTARAYLARFRNGGDQAPLRGLRALAAKAAWVARHPLRWAMGRTGAKP